MHDTDGIDSSVVYPQCASRYPNANLASIHSVEEQMFINQIVSVHDTFGLDYWIGYYKSTAGLGLTKKHCRS